MSNEERQAIIKEKWRVLDEGERRQFVTLARLEEETRRYKMVKEFYTQRIEFSRAAAPLPDLKLLIAGYAKTPSSSTNSKS